MKGAARHIMALLVFIRYDNTVKPNTLIVGMLYRRHSTIIESYRTSSSKLIVDVLYKKISTSF